MSFSTASFWSISSTNSSRNYARAASDTSYKYYNNMSWSMWCAMGPSQNHTIWGMWETLTGAKRSWLFSTQTDGTFRTIFSWDGTNFSLLKTVNPIFDFSWINIIVTFTNGVQAVYVNNVLQTMTTSIAWGGGVAGLNAAGVQHMIGDTDPSTPPIDGQFTGCFNNFSLWSKVLSAQDRADIYNGGLPTDLSTHASVANLTNWIRADQSDTAPTLIDSVTTAANMTITKSGTTQWFNQTNQHQEVSSTNLDQINGKVNIILAKVLSR